MRLDMNMVQPFDHFSVMNGRGFGDIHSYRPLQGNGWFSQIAKAVMPIIAPVAKEALSGAVRAGSQQALKQIDEYGRAPAQQMQAMAREAPIPAPRRGLKRAMTGRSAGPVARRRVR